MTTIFFLRGTGEPTAGKDRAPTGLLAGLAVQLEQQGHVCVDVDYPAAIGPANPHGNPAGSVSMAESLAAGVSALAAAARRHPAAAGKFGVVGYSLGAMVCSRYLEAAAGGTVPVPAFAGLVANPLRAEGDSVDGRARGWGIAGQHGRWPVLPVFEVANPNDAITACAARSPLRPFADVITYAAATDLNEWGADVLGRLRSGRWQQSGGYTFPEYAGAVMSLRGYLMKGEHTAAYWRKPLFSGQSPLDRLAGLIGGVA